MQRSVIVLALAAFALETSLAAQALVRSVNVAAANAQYDNPSVRTPSTGSGGATSGSSCTGAYSFDFNNWIVNGWDGSLAAGSEIYAQYWSRDPASASHTSLSNALRFLVNP